MTPKDRKAIHQAIKCFDENVKTWTKQQCLDWLVKLGTHNPDGTIHRDYGGK